MARLNASRKSYFLSVTPVDSSLTDGTNIPPPQQPQPIETSRPYTPVQPPTPRAGPLTSHPTNTPRNEQQQYPQYSMGEPARDRTDSLPDADRSDNDANRERADSYTDRKQPDSSYDNKERADSFRTPTSPASAAQHSSSSPQAQRQPQKGPDQPAFILQQLAHVAKHASRLTRRTSPTSTTITFATAKRRQASLIAKHGLNDRLFHSESETTPTQEVRWQLV
ncbi:hypothetical protein LTR37_001341 [Vermiconidia calcicola]|uniref:Uncharacterized protein n=1 Tax=Vermiconidia calcicola TaxID=1690605 RepID=A0ACC3NWM0_9PEZI|nr:hypothetical protein LTR37_001341 [Vermiconidia calcicola]